MKMVFSLVFFVFLCVLINSAHAATGASVGKISQMLWYEGHTGLLLKQVGMSDLGGCGRSDYYILDDAHPYFKEIYSLILSAHISSQPLHINLDGCVQGISRIKHVTSNK